MAQPTTPNGNALNASQFTHYKSPHGPKYQYQTHILGFTGKQAMKLGFKTGAFGAVAGFALIFYASGIPRVQRDILQKIPWIGSHYIKEIPASDNPF